VLGHNPSRWSQLQCKQRLWKTKLSQKIEIQGSFLLKQ
jgi:hypothetical protein